MLTFVMAFHRPNSRFTSFIPVGKLNMVYVFWSDYRNLVEEPVCSALFTTSIFTDNAAVMSQPAPGESTPGFIPEERLVGVCRHQVKGWWQEISDTLLKSHSHLSCRWDLMLLCRLSAVCASTECGSVTCSAHTLTKQSVVPWWKRPQVTNVEPHTSYMLPGECGDCGVDRSLHICE